MSFRSALVFAGFALLALFCIVMLVDCGLLEPKLPADRALARGAVLATAEAVRSADQACAEYGTATRDVALLQRCEDHYTAARIALIATGSAVDLWDRAESRQSVTCALERALVDLTQIGEDLDAHGGYPPKIIADARTLVAALGRCSDA